jgi:hypothetical protein
MVYCTIDEAWNRADIPEMKYYNEMPVPTVTPANVYGYNQIDVVPREVPIQHHRPIAQNGYAQDTHTVSTDTSIRPIVERIRNEPQTTTMNSATMNEYKKLIEELKKENAELRRSLQERDATNPSDGMMDVLLYISSGVFLLFFLEHVTSSARRF